MQYKQAIKFNKQYLIHYNNNVTVHVTPCFVSHRFGLWTFIVEQSNSVDK